MTKTKSTNKRTELIESDYVPKEKMKRLKEHAKKSRKSK